MDETLELLCNSLLHHEAALRSMPVDGPRINKGEVEDLKRKIERCERWLHLLRAESVLARARAGAKYSIPRRACKS